MSFAFAILHTAFERNDKFFSDFGSLFKPLSIVATVTLCLAALISLPLIHEKYEISNGLLIFVGAALIPWARVHQSKFLLLWSMVIFYGAIHFNISNELLNPLHLSLLGLAIVIINSLPEVYNSTGILYEVFEVSILQYFNTGNRYIIVYSSITVI